MKSLRPLINALKEAKAKFTQKVGKQPEFTQTLTELRKKIKNVDDWTEHALEEAAKAEMTEEGSASIGTIIESLVAMVSTGEAHIQGAKISKGAYEAMLNK